MCIRDRVKAALEATVELGGEHYVFWGGREGYASLVNTNMKREVEPVSYTHLWESKYTININTEMNYWPSEPNALHECVQPLEQMLWDFSQTGAHTAKAMYGAGGWMAHNNTCLLYTSRCV